MKKSTIFGKRNFRELIRDPLSWIFCILFPIAMLLIFYIIGRNTPGAEEQFALRKILPGIAYFSFTFDGLFAAIIVSRDKTTSFLSRLFTSPMKPNDYLFGYFTPIFVIAIIQTVLCFITGIILSAVTGESIGILNLVVTFLLLLPCSLFFIFIGISVGCVFSDKSAPGICSALITFAGMLSGAWMPIETMGGFETFCKCLPFYPSVSIARCGMTETLFKNTDSLLVNIIVAVAYTVLSLTLVNLSLKRLIKKDK